MRRANFHDFYRLGMFLHPVADIQEGTLIQQIAWRLNTARTWINWLLSDKLVTLVVSRSAAQRVVRAIDGIIPEKASEFSSIDADASLDGFKHWLLTDALHDLETLLAAELPTFDTYIVSKKGIYSTADLVERAENAIDETVCDALSAEVKSDFNQAGRCLAFELPTAAGFHTMRSVEAVLRTYWMLATKPADGVRPPEMAQCINELRKAGEDPKLMDVLDHIRDLHRNTIMHPEVFLDMKDALRLFDISKSAISAMGDRIIALTPAVTATLRPSDSSDDIKSLAAGLGS